LFKQRSYTIALVISLILHFIILLAYSPLSSFSRILRLSSIPEIESMPERQPLEFELVETPSEAAVDKAPDDAQFLSDKNARAQDQYAANDLEKGLSYSEGETQYKLFAGGTDMPMPPVQPSPQQTNEAEQQQEQDSEQEENKAKDDNFTKSDLALLQQQPVRRYSRFSKDLLGGSPGQSSRAQRQFSDDVNWDNRKFSAEELGGVSLSTYAWDFAPYIFYMKKRLRDHIYPPPAFMRMGAISGEVVVRFKVYPDGRTEDIKVLNYRGHKALVETSINAVKASNPFRPLPEDFPENYLELTWTFIYSITR